VIVAAAVVLALGHNIVHRTVTRRVPEYSADTDSNSVARGRHVAEIVCAGCHSPDGNLPLAGGQENLFHIPNGPTFGVMVAPNLTQAGVLAQYSDGQLARAIREGISRDGRPLVVMPSGQFHSMSDADLRAVIGFLRSQPAVAHAVPAHAYNLLGYGLLGAHMFEDSVQPEIRDPVIAPAQDSSAAYGRYLVRLLGCRDCHGTDLHGGKKGQLPPIGPDLIAVVAAHSIPEFDLALRRGVSARDGHALDPAQMPFATFSHASDLEVAALYRYLKSGAGD
jgi:mono/diheme cytochrome c family protein